MKIGIFLHNFSDTEINKDPGLIARGLLEAGINIFVYSYQASALAREKLPLQIISRTQARRTTFWQDSHLDTIIIYSWLSLRYTKLIAASKAGGLKVILKLDSDGHLIYPLRPSYLKVFGLDRSLKAKLIHVLRLLQYILLSRWLAKKKLKQLELCDATIIETPLAYENLVTSLRAWRRDDLIKKIIVIPNPVLEHSNLTFTKNNLITAIGRWDDRRKNASSLIAVLSQIRTDWEVKIIGQDGRALAQQIKKNNPTLKITGQEQIPHAQLLNILAPTKILFAPSLTESFNLAAAEALTRGATLCGGPLESFKYFARDNFSGCLATDFSSPALTQALEQSLKNWSNNQYSAEAIAQYWKSELGLSKICQQILNI